MSDVSVKSDTIVVETDRWGSLEIDLDEVITFADGIPGFDAISQFVLLKSPEIQPFFWLLSIEEPEIAFVMVDPQDFLESYQPRLFESDLLELDTEGQDKMALFAIVTVAPNPVESTANLQGPILVNTTKRRGKQIVVADEHYTTQHPIMNTAKNKNNKAPGRSQKKSSVASS